MLELNAHPVTWKAYFRPGVIGHAQAQRADGIR